MDELLVGGEKRICEDAGASFCGVKEVGKGFILVSFADSNEPGSFVEGCDAEDAGSVAGFVFKKENVSLLGCEAANGEL